MKLSESNTIVCNASRDEVFRIIQASAHWPDIFEPCLAVRHIKHDVNGEHIEVTALVNGQPMQWESIRTFMPGIHGINSVVVKPMKLVSHMETSWRVVSLNQEQSLLVLEHTFGIVDEPVGLVDGVHNAAEAEAFMRQAIRSNSTTELGNIKAVAERHKPAAPTPHTFETAHAIVCDSAAFDVYAALVDVGNWPQIIEACTAAHSLYKDGQTELVRIEAIQGDQAVSWDTHRTYQDDILRIDFHLPVPMPLLQHMSGQWRVVPLSDQPGQQRCVLHVTRHFQVKDDVRGIHPGIDTVDEAAAFLHAFTMDNGQNEMEAIKSFVEKQQASYLAFKTRHILPHAPDKVYAVLAGVAQWHKVLPHCDGVDVIYDDSENQEFVMSVRTLAGQEQFRSIRRCDPQTLSISYFQPKPPAVLQTHSGSWSVRSVPEGAEVTSVHRVCVDAGQAELLFKSNELSANKARIKELIARNSKATVDACGAWLSRQHDEVTA